MEIERFFSRIQKQVTGMIMPLHEHLGWFSKQKSPQILGLRAFDFI